MATPIAARSEAGPQGLRSALASRVVVADGAMGTMLQAHDPTLEDYQGYEGCNEILNVTRPDIVLDVHRQYLDVGVDCIETNTFGANFGNLLEYGITERIYELAKAGAELARQAADDAATDEHPRWVLGSVGPGTKLPSLGHETFAVLRDAYQEQVRGLIDGGADAILIETSQDLLQAKAALIGARRAMTERDVDLPLIAQVTVETTGTMLLGSEIGAALTALEPLGIDLIGLNCATGPLEMSEHLRTLSQSAVIGLSCMPNAGLPVLTSDGAYYPLSPDELADAHEQFVRDYGIGLVGGCCGTTPEHLKAVVERVRQKQLPARTPLHTASAASLYQSVPFRQDATYLAIGERTNANGSKAFREAMLAEQWDDCIEIARAQIREGAHMLDLCVDYVGRDGARDMRELASRLATSSTLPIMLDSTEPAVIQAGLESLGGRAVINSVNFEDGDGPDSRFAAVMPMVVEHGAAVVALTIDEEGQARTAEWKLRVARRLIQDLTQKWGMSTSDIIVDTLTFPIGTGQEETRRDGLETIEAIRELKREYPDVQTTLGLSNVSFGLNPAARQVLNSVFLHECMQAGLDSAIVHPSKILPLSKIDQEHIDVALDLIYDRREWDEGVTTYDPLQKFLALFEGVEASAGRVSKAEELAALPLNERLQRRIIDGERQGLEGDLDLALAEMEPLVIVNDHLLEGMKVVGDLFGSGQMQLPFVLQSAEVMKQAVAYLEPHMERTDEAGKGTLVLATVKGDVHDIGKNLVDIILTNNGYNVVNIGIKQPINTIIDAAIEHNADAIGMSGLLVKSTVIMKENLEEINRRELANRFPVLLGGAALTRAYVEQDLADIFHGEVRYARDAFEGLSLMDALMAVKRGDEGAALPARRERKTRKALVQTQEDSIEIPSRSDVAIDNPIPQPPFWGDRVVRGISLAEYVPYLDERALFMGQWGLKSSRGEGQSYEELVETEGRPRLRYWLDRISTEKMIEPAVVYGYFPAVSEGDTLHILNEPHPDSSIRASLEFPRQRRDRFLCLSDFYRPRSQGVVDVVAFHVVTMGHAASRSTASLFETDSYRDYLELHGLSVQLTEALAEYWHARIRSELGLDGLDHADMTTLIAKQGYQGSRYSFGYPACPDIEQQTVIMDLLNPERIGVTLSEEFQLDPEQSTSAIIAHHPEAKYFNAG